MNIKTSEFAARYGISDRHARRLLADHAGTLDGHFKKNTKGTWIDQYAADFLYGLLRNPMEIVPTEFAPDVEDLQRQIRELKEENRTLALKWGQALERADDSSGVVALLAAAESREKALSEKNEELLLENGALKAQNGLLNEESEKKDKLLQEERETSQKAKDELSGVFGELRRTKEELQAEKTRKLTFKERLFGRKQGEEK